ncbi:hypothetical protein MBLNU457_1458t1 [Dothideomycetes sp. NU457]
MPQQAAVPVAQGNALWAIVQALFYTAFAAVSGSLSQLTLAPVFGSIPAAAQHDQILRWALLLAFLAKDAIMQYLPPNPKRYLPVVAFYVPMAQYFFSRDSNRIGASAGPAASESLTFFPLVLLSAICITDSLDVFPAFKRTSAVQVSVGLVVWLALSYSAPLITQYLASLPLLTDLPIPAEYFSRVNLQLATAAVAAPLAPSLLQFLAIPAIYHASNYNVHFGSNYHTSLLNATLRPRGWTLIDRQESNTGYISVLESMKDQYRVLRCDHSLLGGEWLPSPARIADGITNNEPIYAVFNILEAVRLVEIGGVKDKKTDSEKKALVIGAGIGTSPKALLAHGIDTTIVELDPVVHDFATRYFGLPTNHTAVLENALTWVQGGALAQGAYTRYDYIIHDVFTGGAEPLDLFTDSFLADLRSLLTPEGVIAINYAGDVGMSPAKQVLNTISNVFEGRCRLFRDLPAEGENGDFSNMVIFCVNPAAQRAAEGFSFRKPVDADFLGTVSRQNYLLPRSDLELRFPTQEELVNEKVQTITKSTVNSFKKEQLKSAERHWKIMREVIPPFVWENW